MATNYRYYHTNSKVSVILKGGGGGGSLNKVDCQHSETQKVGKNSLFNMAIQNMGTFRINSFLKEGTYK